jgi:hypothetical protein
MVYLCERKPCESKSLPSVGSNLYRMRKCDVPSFMPSESVAAGPSRGLLFTVAPICITKPLQSQTSGDSSILASLYAHCIVLIFFLLFTRSPRANTYFSCHSARYGAYTL